MRTTLCLLAAGLLTAAELPAEITALQGGVVVTVGGAQLDALKPLAAQGRWAVEAIMPDAKAALTLRAKLAADLAYGLLSVADVGPAANGALPYVDRIATVTVIDRDAPGAPSDAEIDRITSPFGVIWQQQGGTWSIRRSKADEGWDEWKHQLYDNAQRCLSYDKISGPLTGMSWNDMGETLGKDGSSGYRLHQGVAVTMEAALPGDGEGLKGVICARDAFNGAMLWRQPIVGQLYESVSMIAHEGTLIAALRAGQPAEAFDIRTGVKRITYDQGAKLLVAGGKDVTQTELTIANGQLIQSAGRDLIALDPKTGAKKWSFQDVEGRWLYALTAGDDAGLVFASSADQPVYRGRRLIDSGAREVLAVDAKTSELRWRWAVPTGTDIKPHAGFLTYDRKQLLVIGINMGIPFRTVHHISLIDTTPARPSGHAWDSRRRIRAAMAALKTIAFSMVSSSATTRSSQRQRAVVSTSAWNAPPEKSWAASTSSISTETAHVRSVPSSGCSPR